MLAQFEGAGLVTAHISQITVNAGQGGGTFRCGSRALEWLFGFQRGVAESSEASWESPKYSDVRRNSVDWEWILVWQSVFPGPPLALVPRPISPAGPGERFLLVPPSRSGGGAELVRRRGWNEISHVHNSN